MAMFENNVVHLIGNLGKDAEVKKLSNGQKLVFSLATMEEYEGKKRTDWHNVQMFGKFVDQYKSLLVKGITVHVVGKLRTDTWTDNQQQHRTFTYVVGLRVDFSAEAYRQKTASRTTPGDSSGPIPPDDDDFF